jgi:hypothetical protein
MYFAVCHTIALHSCTDYCLHCCKRQVLCVYQYLDDVLQKVSTDLLIGDVITVLDGDDL